MNDNETLLAIQKLLDGTTWTPDTLDEIANLMIASGYNIRNCTEGTEEHTDEYPLEPEETGKPVESWIVVAGNPVDGFACYGPFADHDAALREAESGRANEEAWWIATMYSPE